MKLSQGSLKLSVRNKAFLYFYMNKVCEQPEKVYEYPKQDVKKEQLSFVLLKFMLCHGFGEAESRKKVVRLQGYRFTSLLPTI